eukprot:scaffold15254_cov84-Isochrysis_galbana.AAC.1
MPPVLAHPLCSATQTLARGTSPRTLPAALCGLLADAHLLPNRLPLPQVEWIQNNPRKADRIGARRPPPPASPLAPHAPSHPRASTPREYRCGVPAFRAADTMYIESYCEPEGPALTLAVALCVLAQLVHRRSRPGLCEAIPDADAQLRVFRQAGGADPLLGHSARGGGGVV